jgi:hypothetical protein
MDNLEKVKRHLAKQIPVKITNPDGEEDVFQFNPLNVEQQAILMELSRRMQGREKIMVEGVEIPSVNKEDMKEMFDLLLDITRKSISGIDEETLIKFVNDNFDQLSEKISDLIPKTTNQSALDKIKKAQEEHRVKSGNKPTA